LTVSLVGLVRLVGLVGLVGALTFAVHAQPVRAPGMSMVSPATNPGSNARQSELGAGQGGGTGSSVTLQSSSLQMPVIRPVTARDALPFEEQRVVTLFETAAPAVAYITTELVQTNALFEREVSQGAGSGFLWDGNGHIVTSNHVIDNARRIFVQLDAGKAVEATVVGRAPEYDLAVIRLAISPLSAVPNDVRPIALGDSKSLRIGQRVYAIGNPFGLHRTMTQGIVSALDRELPTTSSREVLGVIQTDAAINPGSSGGPLLDSAGRLVGVNAAIRPGQGGFAGIGFAIPVDLVNRIVPALIARGRAPLPGIGVTPMRPDVVARAGITGVVLTEVDAQSPAAEAGLVPYNKRTGEIGDVITAANGRPVLSMTALVGEMDRSGINNTIELTVQRHFYPSGQKERSVRVKVIDLRR
jgi:2-alkenal reductase